MSIVGNPLLLGGGKSDVFAFIVVTYPAGSTLTATKGSKVLTAGDTTGTWVFDIPEAGTWKVTITLGGDTATEDVSITSKGQSEGIKLNYHVPDGYTELKFIKTTGSQYINLNRSDSEIHISGKVKFTQLGRNTILARLVPGLSSAEIGLESNKQRLSIGTVDAYGITPVIGTLYDYSADLFSNTTVQSSFALNDSVCTATKNKTEDNNLNYYLFASNNNNTVALFSNLESWGVILIYTTNNVKLFEMYPCIRDSDSSVGFWDNVSESFITSNGNPFVAGEVA